MVSSFLQYHLSVLLCMHIMYLNLKDYLWLTSGTFGSVHLWNPRTSGTLEPVKPYYIIQCIVTFCWQFSNSGMSAMDPLNLTPL